MKKIIITLLAAAAGLLFQIPASAQSGSEEETIYHESVDSIKVFKTVAGPDKNDEYLITLSTFVTGYRETHEDEVHTPIDIALVIDASGSMTKTIPTESNKYYKHTHNVSIGAKQAGFSAYGNQWKDDDNASTYYYYTGGKYYPVHRYEYTWGKATHYCLYYETDETVTNPITGKQWKKRYFISDKGVSTCVANIEIPVVKKGKDILHWGGYPDDEWDSYNEVSDYVATSPETVLYTGVLYSKSRMGALWEAVSSFTDIIQQNDTQYLSDATGHNRVAVVRFSSDYSTAVGDTKYKIPSGLYHTNSQVVKGLTNISSISSYLKDLSQMTIGGVTRTDNGMRGAIQAFGSKDPNRKRVVILLTDGTPYTDVVETDIEPGMEAYFNPNDSPFLRVSNRALQYANVLKNDYNAEIYVVGLGLKETDSDYEDTYKFLEYVSSDYPSSKSMTNPGSQKYSKYVSMTDSGAGLKEIFEAIAKNSSLTEIGYNLDDGNSVVFDALTKHFMLPDDITVSNTGRISVGTRDFIGMYGANYNFSSTIVPMNPSDYTVTVGGADNKEIIVSGFNYAENWVGNIIRYQGTSKPTLVPHGKELVIQIPIVIDPANPGGASVETNDPKSGVYFLVDGGLGDPIKLYPIPTLKMPNILIIKNGLKEKDSAIFKISRLKDDGSEDATYEPFVVMETADASGTAKAMIKLVGEGRYKVTEEPWSWAYTTTPETSYAEDDGKTSGSGNYIIRNVNGTTANAAANATLYIFNNEPKKNMPAHDEDAVNNVFFTPNTLIQVVK